MKPDGLLGPNSCNIDPEGLQMSCNVAYHGNIKPMLQWREIRSIDYIEKGLYCWWTGFNVTCDVALKASFDLHGSSYVCETTRHSCSSGVVRVIRKEQVFNYTIESLFLPRLEAPRLTIWNYDLYSIC